MHMSCPFCEIAKSTPVPSTVFYSTPHALAFLDIQPLITASAHILVIPRTHYETLDKLADDPVSAAALGKSLAIVAKALKLAFCDGDEGGTVDYNVVQNNGIGAGQVVDHVHFHLVVRNASSSSDETKNILSSDNTKYISEQMKISSSISKTLPLLQNPRFRLSYAAQVFAKGQRTDLDEEWAAELSTLLKSCVDKVLESVSGLSTSKL